jgi:putative ABC transport system permease protein
LVVTASATAFGIATFASSVGQTLRATAHAKSVLGLGAEQVVPVGSEGVIRPESALFDRATVVFRTTESTSLVKGHDPVDLLGVEDPTTFARSAFWDRSFASTPLSLLMQSVSADRSDGNAASEVNALAAGPGIPDRFEVTLTGLDGQRMTMSIRIVARARYFPGLNYDSTRSLLVIDSAVLRNRAIAADRQIWVGGSDDPGILDEVRSMGFEAGVVRRASARTDSNLLPQIWALRFLTVSGAITGVLAICSIGLYFAAIGRRRLVGDAMAHQMGLTRRSAATATTLEIGSMLVMAGLAGIALAWLALRLVYRRLDLSPSSPPGPLLRLDLAVAWWGLALAAIISFLIAAAIETRHRHVDFNSVIRHAG